MNARREVARRMSEAAATLLDSLDAEQRALAGWPFPADDERRLWFYTPTDHGGLPLSAMRPAQQRHAMQLVAHRSVAAGVRDGRRRSSVWRTCSTSSKAGVVGWERERGRDPGLYYVRVFGVPDEGGTWAWRFGGHHVSINHTIVDGEVAGSHAVLPRRRPGIVAAARPAPAPAARRCRGSRPGSSSDSLDDAQRAATILSPVAPVDLVTGEPVPAVRG